MKKFLIIATATSAVLGLGSFAYLVSFIGSTIAINERHPHLDYETVRAAHWSMVKRALKGEIEDVDTEDDEVMDRLFLEEVARLANH